MSSTLNFIESQQSRIHKQWHENINNEMRKHLVQKIIQTIFPTQDHNIYRANNNNNNIRTNSNDSKQFNGLKKASCPYMRYHQYKGMYPN